MEAADFPSPRRAAQDLTHVEEFALGPLAVDPPSRRVSAGGRSEMLEPRVMRVLVAFGEAGGKVLSRDDLIALCWDGVVVGNNAINQTISRLRHVFDDLSGGAVRLETITKVGFRLVVDRQADGAAPLRDSPSANAGQSASVIAENATASRRWSRRSLGIGLAATGAVAALGAAVWPRLGRHVPDPRAVKLYRRGQAIQEAGEYDTMGEAIEACKQAVAIDPRYSEAWGALALSYRYPVVGPIVRLRDPQGVRAAAKRALALDPGNADARLALITLDPCYRSWREHEAQLRALLRDHPDSALGHVRLGELLMDVGRIEDAVTVSKHAIGIDPTQKVCWYSLAWAYYYAGRDHEADLAIEEARTRWPQDCRLYARGYFFILGSKRYGDALAYIRDSSRRPRILGRELAESWMNLAEALETGRGIAEAESQLRTVRAMQMESLPYQAPDLALFGMVDEMFTLFEAFFFGGMVIGKRIDPPGPLDPRPSGPLFAPAVLSLRNDSRYTSLLARTGLEDYWRKSGTQPDFRRQ